MHRPAGPAPRIFVAGRPVPGDRQTQLTQPILTGQVPGRRPRLEDRRQEQRREQRRDAQHHQEFQYGEARRAGRGTGSGRKHADDFEAALSGLQRLSGLFLTARREPEPFRVPQNRTARPHAPGRHDALRAGGWGRREGGGADRPDAPEPVTFDRSSPTSRAVRPGASAPLARARFAPAPATRPFPSRPAAPVTNAIPFAPAGGVVLNSGGMLKTATEPVPAGPTRQRGSRGRPEPCVRRRSRGCAAGPADASGWF